MEYSEILKFPPFSLDKKDKSFVLTERLLDLTERSCAYCAEYKMMMAALGFEKSKISDYYDIPFLTVGLFKEIDLISIPKDELFKTMTSSGTTGQAVSKIYLDRLTAANQQKTLVKIVSEFTGPNRLPMLVIDSPSVLKDRTMFSARGAGILGFSVFGLDITYALNDDMELELDVVEAFIERHQREKILLFGFTFMVWQHFYKTLAKRNVKLSLPDVVLIHGGGWKKLIREAVSKEEFRNRMISVCGNLKVHDYYGMVEQTGSIYMECEYGHLHASVFSDVITRRHLNFSACDVGESGIIQVVSMLPESYPGHSILTEDEGIVLGEDDCPCKRKGKYFEVIGRVKDAEIRGCSDAYAAKF